MKTLLRLIRRGILYLVAQSSYPTSRERMMGMFTLGKEAGRKEALKDLPITQVQPRQMTARVYLPPGEWSRRYRESNLIVPKPVRTNTEPIDEKTDFPPWINSEQAEKMDDQEWTDWLNSKPPVAVEHMTPAEIERVPTIRDLTPAFDPDDTNEVPAIMKLLYQERQARQAG